MTRTRHGPTEVFAHDARGLRRPLVEEEMPAPVEGTQLSTGDLPLEDARVFEGNHHVVGAMKHERRHCHSSEPLERVVRLPHRLELRCEHARADRMTSAFAYLRFDEVAVGSLKLRRIQHRARNPVRLLRRARSLAKQRRLIGGLWVHTMLTARRCRRKKEMGDATGMVHDHVLRDEPSHRCSEHRSRADAGGVEDRDRVQGHRGEGHIRIASRLADAARIKGDHAVLAHQVRDDWSERRSTRAEAGNEQQRVTVAVDDDRQWNAVGRVRGHALLGHASTIAGRPCRTMHAAMPRFYVEPEQVYGGHATLRGADAKHLARSLRALPGETIIIVEAGRIEHGLTLEDVTPVLVSGRIAWSRPAAGEPRLAVHVLQAVPAQAMDATIEALTEAGAATIRPVLTHRTVARPDPSRVIHRLERWRLIAREAAQLAGRAAPPEVHSIVPLQAALDALSPGMHLVVCISRASAVPIHTVLPAARADVALVIGPEGGLDVADLSLLDAAGAVSAHLGPRTLPSRLAGALATTLLLAAAGDLDSSAEPPPA